MLSETQQPNYNRRSYLSLLITSIFTSVDLKCFHNHSNENHNEGVVRFDEQIKLWKSIQPNVCCVCLDGTNSEMTVSQKLLKCSNVECDVCVHGGCYGVQEMGEGEEVSNWTCDSCKNDFCGENECALCPQGGGAMKKDISGRAWVHVSCAIWHREVKINGKTCDIDISRLPNSAFSHYCYLCSDDDIGCGMGACISCNEPGCSNSFHVSCAMRWNLLKVACFNDEMEFDYFCHHHAPAGQEFQINEWENWRYLKQNLHDIDKLHCENTNDRHMLLQKTENLLKERELLEIALLDMQKKRIDRKRIFSTFRNEKDSTMNELNLLQNLLLKLFFRLNELNIDWCSMFQVPSFECIHSQAVNVLDFFIKLGSMDDSIVMLDGISSFLSPAQVTPDVGSFNLSAFCKLPKDDIMKSMNSVKICRECKCRNLPVTAPVLPSCRNVLLSCSNCDSCFHLCCLPSPKFHIDSNYSDETEWKCHQCLEKNEEFICKRKLPISASLLSVNTLNNGYDDSIMDVDVASRKKKVRKIATIDSPAVSRKRQRKPYHESSVPKSVVNHQECNDFDFCVSLDEAKSALLEITGSIQPPLPESLKRMQNNVEENELALRAFVFEQISKEEWKELRRAAMWRLVTNIPPGVNPADIVSLRKEGEHYGYGKVVDAFQSNESSIMEIDGQNDNLSIKDNEVKQFQKEEEVINSDESTAISDDNNEDISECNEYTEEYSVGDIIEDDADDDDYDDSEVMNTRTRRNSMSLTKKTKSSNACSSSAKRSNSSSGKGSLKPERVPSRWDGDLYKPLWTRGNGRTKEGWCALCKPGQWLKTKTSVYWYHMHNFHGISSIAGDFFVPPEQYRLSSSTGLKEGFCGHCKKWIPIQADKQVNVEEIYWFKHAQKCHKYVENV